jgi:hypothetical protein
MVRVLQQRMVEASSGVIILTSPAQPSHQARSWPPGLRMTQTPCVSTTILVLLFITSPHPPPAALSVRAGHTPTAAFFWQQILS